MISPADDSDFHPNAERLLQRIAATLEMSELDPDRADREYRDVSGILGGELIDVWVRKDGSSVVINGGSAAATATLAWTLRDLGELQVYDEAYNVAVALDEVETVGELARRLDEA